MPTDPRDKEYWDRDAAKQKAVDKRGYYTADDTAVTLRPSQVTGAPLPKAPTSLSTPMTPQTNNGKKDN